MTVPPGSNTGTTLCLRGKGVRDAKSRERGHQFITLLVVLPKEGDPEPATFLQDRAPGPGNDPRKEMLA